VILATAGHIDHGKTSLVRALTGVDADRLPEEKRRGLTIDLGFAYGRLPDGGEIGFVDVPGHERFLPNMLAGILVIDRVLLVVAADDGPRPQTTEHLDILELIGVADITGVVTKTDRAGPERTAAVVAEVAALLAEAGYPAAPIFSVSNHTGTGLPALVAHLEETARCSAAARAERRPAGLFRMAIDRAFTLAGIGLVVTGTATAGQVAVGDRLMLSPRGIAVRVRGLHAQNRAIDTATAGERCAVNLSGDSSANGGPRRGDWLVAPERHLPARRLDLSLTVSRHAPAPLRDGLLVHLHLGTADVVGRAAVLAGRSLMPGETGFAQVDLDEPIAALHGDRAVLRDHGARLTLAGGRVVDPLAPRRGRRLPARLASLHAMAPSDPATALSRMLTVAGVVDLAQFALCRNLVPADLAALTEDAAAGGFLRVGSERAPIAITAERLTALADEISEALAIWHREQPDTLGPTRAALLTQLRPAAPEAALDTALDRLVAAGRAVREGGMWRLAEHRPRLGAADEKLWARVRPLLAAGDLRSPRVREVAAELALDPEAVLRLLRRAERLGRVAKIADNRFFLPETVTRLAAIARDLAAAAAEGAFTAAAFNDRSGVGRNLTIQILEYLDRVGTTRRIGEARVMVEAAETFE
jgi:selenocysteine-specific elongation factor